MRKINYIVMHCTMTSQDATIEAIQGYWRNVLGWQKPGYHYIIKKHGTIIELLPIQDIANGVAGHNADSIHISYIGGVDKIGNSCDNRTTDQIDSQIELLQGFRRRFPDAKILGHDEFSGVSKKCPGFSVQQWLKTIDLKL